MLSYQHGYHAGNFADVIKHLCLTRILAYLSQKDKPLLYVDTHAGRGLYDLKDGQALKNCEFREGISLLWEQRKEAPNLCDPYFQAIASVNLRDDLRYYPGSPYLGISSLSSKDRLVFSERHGQEFSFLEQIPTGNKRVFFKNSDGMKELIALVPPIERRAMVFIDPSYEVKEEYKSIPKLIKTAYTRFATGVFCLWYPIVTDYQHRQIRSALQNIAADKVLNIEFFLRPGVQDGMHACGLWIINPPYVLANEMKILLTFLKNVFNTGISTYKIE